MCDGIHDHMVLCHRFWVRLERGEALSELLRHIHLHEIRHHEESLDRLKMCAENWLQHTQSHC